jgi:hypothetical protein
MRPVRIGGVTDPSDPVTVWVTDVHQDEPAEGRGDGDTPTDAVLQPDGSVLLRSERSGLGNGRVYQVGFSADDGRGGTCAGVVSVCVPHDPKRPCVDGGPLYDSLAP